VKIIDATTPSAADVVRRSAAEVDGPLRAAIALLPAQLRSGAGFHLGWWDADGNTGSHACGKMLRPAFALTSARAVSGHAGSAAVRAGVAVELVHNFSLVHDDVMDVDEVRRGRPTVWAEFGVPYAILLGDALLALASQVLARGGDTVAAGLCGELNDVVVALCLGQHLDMVFEGRGSISTDDYLEMVAGKTSALLAGACALGGLAGGADVTQLAALREFGHQIGLAFQLVDDVLGIWGDPVVTGKPAGADLQRYKKSMPVVAAMGSGTSAGEELAEMYEKRAITGGRDLARAVHLVERSGAREWTESRARTHHRLAVESLDGMTADPTALDDLRALAGLMVDRNR